jgi:transcriptional regulator GlxA family with amidase domain
MTRRDLLQQAAALGLLSSGLPVKAKTAPSDTIPVAFLLSDGAVMIDFTGPWEVFQDAYVIGRMQPAFSLYTVAETTRPLETSGGATILPHYALHAAPAPKIVVVPAQSNPTASVKEWLVSVSQRSDLVMSVCTGALVLAEAGLLDGHTVTTHHGSLTILAMRYPKVTVKRGVRFVDDGRIATSAGLSAGIDLALHVVARYYGTEAARQTAYYMEYQSTGWLDGKNSAYQKPPVAHAGDAICAVCWMEVDPKHASSLTYEGRSYYFCMPAHEQAFAAAPQRFLNA